MCVCVCLYSRSQRSRSIEFSLLIGRRHSSSTSRPKEMKTHSSARRCNIAHEGKRLLPSTYSKRFILDQWCPFSLAPWDVSHFFFLFSFLFSFYSSLLLKLLRVPLLESTSYYSWKTKDLFDFNANKVFD